MECPGADFATIQEAVAAASAGDTIIVCPGEYRGRIDITTQDLTIRSRDGADTVDLIWEGPTDFLVYVQADGFSLEDVTVRDAVGYGVYVREVRDCRLEGIRALDNWVGIFLYTATDSVVEYCVVEDNDYGIHISYSSDRNEVRNSIVSNNTAGLYFVGSSENTITGNTFSANSTALLAVSNADNNRIYLNEFIDNGRSVSYVESTNTWSSPSPLTYTYGAESYTSRLGNYWSDYTGVDANGDGVGDTPYEVPGAGADVDAYPLVDTLTHYSVSDDEKVHFADPNLEQAIREAIGKPTGPIYRSDLLPLTSLNASNRGIGDLSGIEHCVNLYWLSLEDNHIADLAPLSGLTNLWGLHLRRNQVSSVAPLSGLSGLNSLSLDSNQLADVTPLSGLTALEYLSLDNNYLTDLSPLSGLTELRRFSLNENQVTELSALTGFTQIRSLRAGNNEIASLAPIASSTRMEHLDVYGNQIVDLSPIAGFEELEVLGASSNPIADLSPLSNLTELRVLWLQNCGLGDPDLLELAGLRKLEKLLLDGNHITDLSPLSALSGLLELHLYNNSVSDLSPVAHLTRLTGLNINYNNVSDLTPLAGLSELTWVFATANSIEDLSPLASCTNLEELQINANRVSDLTPLSNLLGLFYLHLAWNGISDISPLVANSDAGGLGAGDLVRVEQNFLDLSPGSPAMQDIQTLLGRGVDLRYEPQRDGHFVSTPTFVDGPSQGDVGDTLTFSTGGSTCSEGHGVEYRFTWGDGTSSSWSSSTSASNAWDDEGDYQVRAQARCASDHSVDSAWSSALSVTISTPDESGSLVVYVHDEHGGQVPESAFVIPYRNGSPLEEVRVEGGYAAVTGLEPGEYEIHVQYQGPGCPQRQHWGSKRDLLVTAGETRAVDFKRSLPFVFMNATELRFDHDGYVRALVTVSYPDHDHHGTDSPLDTIAHIFVDTKPGFDGEYEYSTQVRINAVPRGSGSSEEVLVRFPKALGTYHWGIQLYTQLPDGGSVLSDCMPFVEALSLEGTSLKVPYYGQYDTGWCLLASHAMAARYYGELRRMETLAAELGRRHDEGTTFIWENPADLTRKELDIFIWDKVKKALDADNPITLSYLKFLVPGHAVVVTGYAEINDGARSDRVVFINDPSGALWNRIYPLADQVNQELFIGARRFIGAPMRYDDLISVLEIYRGSLGSIRADRVLGVPAMPKGTLDINEPLGFSPTFSFMRGVVGPAAFGDYLLYYSRGIQWRFVPVGWERNLSFHYIPVVSTQGSDVVIQLSGFIYNTSWTDRSYRVVLNVLNDEYSVLHTERSIDLPVPSREKATWNIELQASAVHALPFSPLYYLEVNLEDENGNVCDAVGPIPFTRDIDTTHAAFQATGIPAGAQVDAAFAGLPIDQVSVKLDEAVDDLWIIQAELSSVPSPTNAEVFRYTEMVSSSPTSMSHAWLHFAVPRTWLLEYEIDPAWIMLARYVGGSQEWEFLETEQLHDDADQVHYRALTGEFSLFAVCALLDESVVTRKTLGPGWHLMSVPLVGEDTHPTTVFSDVLDSGQPLIVYTWPGSPRYITPGEIDPGRGYWLYLMREVTSEVPDDVKLAGDYEVALIPAGWNLVSTPRWPIAWENVSFERQGASYTLSEAIAEGLIEHIAFRYDAELEDWYVPIDLTDEPGTLDPWTGYWLKTLVGNVTMVIPLGTPSAPTSAAAYTGVIPQELQPPAPPQSPQVGPIELAVSNHPNPVTAGETTFTVTGVAVEYIAVRVFDLSGREVWEGQEEGNSLVWGAANAKGRPLASGVYLYYVEVRVAGNELRTGLEKLLIVR